MKRVFLIFIAFIVLLVPTAAHAQTRDTGSLTLYKAPSSFDNPGQSLGDIEFQINRLSDSPDLNSITVEQALKGEVLLDAPLFARTTAEGERGVARFNNLPLGSYLIQEKPSRSGDIYRAVSAPFFVTIPYAGSEGLVYDLAGVLKTQPITLIKSANTSLVYPGQNYLYILDGVVPVPDINGKLYRYVIKDPLPAGVTYNGENSVEMRSATLNATLREGADYTVTASADQEVVLRLTEVGLAQLAANHQNHQDFTIRFSFGVEAADYLTAGTELRNMAYLYPDGFPEDSNLRDAYMQSAVEEQRPSNIPSNLVVLPVRTTTPVVTTTPRDSTSTTTPRSTSTLPQIPTQPNAATTTSALGAAAGGSNSSRGLATTGASVIALTILGVIFAAFGLIILWRRPSDET